MRDINSPPWLDPQPIIIARVGEQCSVTNTAFDPDIPAQLLRFSLGRVSDANATIDQTNGIFRWRPPVERASTTNYFDIVVTDSGSPSLSATQTLTVLVNDYLAFGPDSTVMQVDQDGGVFLNVYSSAGVIEIAGQLCFPPDRLTNIDITPLVGTATFFPVSPGCYGVHVSAAPGTTFLGNAAVARFSFHTTPNQSAFVSLQMSDVTAQKPGGEMIPQVVARDGRVVVIGREPLLEATGFSQTNFLLTLYGNPGTNYLMNYATNLPPAVWFPGWLVPMTNLSQTFELNAAQPQIFYRAQESR